MEQTSISEALKLLEEAAANKKDELKSAMSDKYTHLKAAIVEIENNLVKSLSEAGEYAVETAVHAKDAGDEKAREFISNLDMKVRSDPWPYIAGTAFGGLLIGYILSRNPK